MQVSAGSVAVVAIPRHSTLSHRSFVDGSLWALTAVCVAATLWFSFVEAPPGAGSFHGADKVMHAFAYFATSLSFLLAAVWRPGRGAGRYPVAGRVVPFVAIGAGIAIEILQGMTATRQAEVGDVVAEVVGVAVAFAVHLWLRKTWGAPATA